MCTMLNYTQSIELGINLVEFGVYVASIEMYASCPIASCVSQVSSPSEKTLSNASINAGHSRRGHISRLTAF